MGEILKFCKHCQQTGDNLVKFKKIIDYVKCGNLKECLRGYLFLDKIDDAITICPHCGNKLIDMDITKSDFENFLLYTDNNPKVVHALMDLYQNDPIDYQIKLNQLKMQYEQRKTTKTQKKPTQNTMNNNTNKLHCPTCNSTKVKKISGTAKVAGAAMFGLFSKTARSQFKCENCGYKW